MAMAFKQVPFDKTAGKLAEGRGLAANADAYAGTGTKTTPSSLGFWHRVRSENKRHTCI